MVLHRLLGIGLLMAAACAAHAQIGNLDTRAVATGLDQPVFAVSPLSDGRVFVVEKVGAIKVVQEGVVSTFLSVPVNNSGEQGLLGLAFDPDYGKAGSAGFRRFFIDYIDPVNGDTVIASYRTGSNGLADINSRAEVLRIDQPAFSNHKAGWIGFKPGDSDHLYIATGDGGGGYDSANFAQNRGVLLGKMLRVDINADDFSDPNVNYGIPDDNPFVGQPGVRGEIFAYGLRNPWRNSFDRLTGDLWIADVGQDALEEVNVIAGNSKGGQNFGWRLREGDRATPQVGGPPPVDNADPVFTYGRSVGRSITGGYVVRAAGSPLNGFYVFGDFVSGAIWATDAANPSFAGAINITALLDSGEGGALGNISSFGFGAGGQLYVVGFGGKVVQVVPEPASGVLLALGLGALVARARRRARIRWHG